MDMAGNVTSDHQRSFRSTETKMSITKKDVATIEALLPLLFGIRGAAQPVAQDAAEALMELLDISMPAITSADHSSGKVVILRKNQDGAL